MDYFLAFLLGIIQGLSEFLPISSSAHLIVFREWLGFESIDDLSFDVALHLGTALALVCCFHHEVRRLALGLWDSLRKPNLQSSLEQRMPWYILAGTVPAAVIGVLLEDVIEHAFILCPGGTIQCRHLPDTFACGEPGHEALPSGDTLVEIEARAIHDALVRNSWNRSATARELGVDRGTIWRKCRQLGIQPPPDRIGDL